MLMLVEKLRKALSLALLAVTASGCALSPAGGLGAHGATTLCSDPSDGSSSFADNEPSLAFPHDGGRLELTVQVGEHFTVGWSKCGEHGQIVTSPSDSSGPITGSDVSVYSSPRPIPSRQPGAACCPRPEADGVFIVRYLAQMPGTQVLHGTGSAGSDGYIEVTVTPLSAAEGALVEGVVDSSALRRHPAPDIVFLAAVGGDGTQTIAKPTADGRFSTRLRPGTYTIMAASPAYNDGRAHCVRKEPVVVGRKDIHDLTVVCTET